MVGDAFIIDAGSGLMVFGWIAFAAYIVGTIIWAVIKPKGDDE
jgi:hypothetical protein